MIDNNDYGFGLEYHLVDSCNLKCAGCSHYSSLLSDKTYPTLEEIIKDMNLLKEKVGNNLRWLRLLGGEPLIHPQITKCLIKIRELFSNTNISIVTNGILLDKMDQKFYDACLELKIKIRITDYGFNKIHSIYEKIKKMGIYVDYYRIANKWHYQHIRLTENRIDCLKRCIYKNICNNYKNGKIYLCPHIAYIEYFNNYFNKDIKLDESDYILLDDVNSFEELIKKIKNAKPNFCFQYCNYYDNTHPVRGKWAITKNDINEFCLL